MKKPKEKLQAILGRFTNEDWASLSVVSLAKQCDCCTRTVVAWFHKFYGMPPRDKRDEFRLKTACKLLLTTKAKVHQVASMSGFPMLHLFHKRFKREYGMTPTQWRLARGGVENINGLKQSGPALAGL